MLWLVENFWFFQALLSYVLGGYLELNHYLFPSSHPLLVPILSIAWAFLLSFLIKTRPFILDMIYMLLLHNTFQACLPFRNLLNWILLTVLVFNSIPFLFHRIIAYQFKSQGLAPPRLNQLRFRPMAYSYISSLAILQRRWVICQDRVGDLEGSVGFVLIVCANQFLCSSFYYFLPGVWGIITDHWPYSLLLLN